MISHEIITLASLQLQESLAMFTPKLQMTLQAHPELKELLQFVFSSDEDDREKILDELKEFNRPEKATSLASFDAEELQQIIEEALVKISEQSIQQLSDRTELDLVTILAFLLSSFPSLLHAIESLFTATFGQIDVLLHRTASESTQIQCIILLRMHLPVLADLNLDRCVKLARVKMIMRALDVNVRPNSVAYTEKIRAHLLAIETCLQLLHGSESEPKSMLLSTGRLERFTFLIQPILQLLASVFTPEPAALHDVNVNNDVKVAANCFQLAHNTMTTLQQDDAEKSKQFSSDEPAPSNTLAFCNANNERIAVTHRLFVLIEKLAAGAVKLGDEAQHAIQYWRLFRSHFVYLALCALWPFALVALTTCREERFRRTLSSGALLAFRAFVSFFELSFTAAHHATSRNELARAAHVRTAQSVLRIVNLIMRNALINSEDAMLLTNTLVCSFSVETLFSRLCLEPKPSKTNDDDIKPSVLASKQYQCNVAPINNHRPKAVDRYLNDTIASVLLHFCMFNSSNDVIERPHAISEFLTLITNVIRRATASGTFELLSCPAASGSPCVALADLLRFCELTVPFVCGRIADYEAELCNQPLSYDFASRKAAYCSAFVHLWVAFASFLSTALSRSIDNNANELPLPTSTSTSFRLNFDLTTCSGTAIARSNRLLVHLLESGLRLCRTVLDYEPMGVKREPLFSQTIDTFELAFDRLCAIFERLFEDRATSCNVDSLDADLPVASALATRNSVCAPAAAGCTHHRDHLRSLASNSCTGSRPTCYQLRLQFDLLRVDMIKCKSVVQRLKEDSTKRSAGKLRRTGRCRSGRQRCKSKRRLSCSTLSKPVEAYTRISRSHAAVVGLGHFSKPQLAGVSHSTPALHASASSTGCQFTPHDATLGPPTDLLANYEPDESFSSSLEALGLEIDMDDQTSELLQSLVQNFDLVDDSLQSILPIGPSDLSNTPPGGSIAQPLHIDVPLSNTVDTAFSKTAGTSILDSGTYSEAESGAKSSTAGDRTEATPCERSSVVCDTSTAVPVQFPDDNAHLLLQVEVVDEYELLDPCD